MMSLLRCPVCRARFTGEEPIDEPCRRCKSDLSLIRQTYAQAQNHRHKAQKYLSHGQYRQALNSARKAIHLLDEEETRMTFSAALTANGEVKSALAVLFNDLQNR